MNEQDVSLSFVMEGNDIKFKANWPAAKDDNEEMKIAQNFCKLAAMSTRSEVLPFLQGFVANKGEKDGRQRLAKVIITILVEYSKKNPSKNDKTPIVEPKDAFKVRGQ
jgi:hypothetical protein